MVGGLFDEVSSSFFVPLAGVNRQLNYELLRLVNERMKDDVGQFPRDVVLDWLTEYLSHSSFDESVDDETMERSEVESYREIASRKLSYFVKCGWLNGEVDTSFHMTYQMDSFAIAILQAIDSYLASGEESVQLTHFVYSIYLTLKNGFEMSHAVDAVQSISDNQQKLSGMLRSLNSNVRKFLNRLLRDVHASPSEILGMLLLDYQNSVVLKSFENLRRRDNPSKYKEEIISRIDDLLSDHLSEMVDNAIAVTYSGDNCERNRKEAEIDFCRKLGDTRELFEHIEKQIQVINQRNTRYVRTTKSRLSYLLNEDRDLEGRIVRLLKGIEESGFSGSSPWGVTLEGLVNPDSLFQPRKVHKRVVSRTPVSEGDVDPSWRETHAKRLKRAMEFSISRVDRFILQALGERASMLASEVPLSGSDDFLRLLLAELYSASPLVHYRARLRDDSFSFQGRRMTNFVIEKRRYHGLKQ